MSAVKEMTGIILAGGKSSRMGQEKGLIQLNGKPFIEHILLAIQPLVTEVIVVSSNSDYDTYVDRRVEDIILEAGPIAGIHAGLVHSKTENNIIVSCDVPLITTQLLTTLIRHKEEDVDVVQFEAMGETIPLIALYKKRCIYACREALDKSQRSLRKLITTLKVKTIKVTEKELFSVANINTKEDLKTVEK